MARRDPRLAITNYIAEQKVLSKNPKSSEAVMKNLECFNAIYSILPELERKEMLRDLGKFSSMRFEFRGIPDKLENLVSEEQFEPQSGEMSKKGVFLTNKASYAIDFTKSILFAYRKEDVCEDRECIDTRRPGYWHDTDKRMREEYATKSEPIPPCHAYDIEDEVHKKDTVSQIPYSERGHIYTRVDPLKFCDADKIFVLCSKEDKECVMLPEGLEDKVVSVEEVEWCLPMSRDEIKEEMKDKVYLSLCA